MKKSYDYVIVGAGLFGSVLAERIATQSDYSVLVVDKRDHIGGNCYSCLDEETGIEYHKYGPHIFHTSSARVWRYIGRFSEFNSYCHRVKACHKGEVYALPINLSLINRFFGLNLTPSEAEELIGSKQIPSSSPRNFEDLALASVGSELYKAFFKGYTQKQWGRDPRTLPATNFSRLPVRFSYNDCYYNDIWCGVPLDGYTAVFTRLLDHNNVDVLLEADFFSARGSIGIRRKLVYSGPIDEYFGYCHGRLGYRTVDLAGEVHPVADYQGISQMNYPDADVAHTRIIEPKHFHPERRPRGTTFIQREYPREDDGANPMYPIRTESDLQKLAKYRVLTKKEKNVVFGGRLGRYQYLDMDEVIEAALDVFETAIRKV